MRINTLQIDSGDSNYYSTGFRQIIEDHLPHLKKSKFTKTVTLNPQSEYKYIGDFYSLLQSLSVQQDLFWITMRVNDLHSPLDYNGDLIEVLLPERYELDSMLTRFLTETII